MLRTPALLVMSCLWLAACTLPASRPPHPLHLQPEDHVPEPAIPPLLPELPLPARPAGGQHFTLAVQDAPVQEVLHALAREADLNMDIHPGLTGTVTLHARNQQVSELLTRMARQVELRFSWHDSTLVVEPDTPVLRQYSVDYVNLSRHTSAALTANTQITAPQTQHPGVALPGVSQGAYGHVSATRIETQSRHLFWDSLERNLRDLLRESDKHLPRGSEETVIESQQQDITSAPARHDGLRPPIDTDRHARAGNPHSRPAPLPPAGVNQHSGHDVTTIRRSTVREAASVIVHRETGLISVRATGRQHDKIADFLQQLRQAAGRQVLIEATIVEVELDEAYRQGIEWSRLREDGSGFRLTGPESNQLGQSFVLSGRRATPLDLSATLELLHRYGQVRVLSSPRLSVLNNQSALLKVVEDVVYFAVRADTVTTTNTASVAVSTTPQSVSVGLVMQVTPQISADQAVTLMVRPSISSIVGYRDDPNPQIPAGIRNRIPQIRTREMESMLRLHSGDIAVLGGLMEDRSERVTSELPGSEQLGLLGEALRHHAISERKSELLVFIRPWVITDTDYGPLAGYYRQLANQTAAPGTTDSAPPSAPRVAADDTITTNAVPPPAQLTGEATGPNPRIRISRPPTPASKGNDHYQQALKLAASGAWAQALPLLEHSAHHRPDALAVRYHLALAFDHTGDLAMARSAYQQLLTQAADTELPRASIRRRLSFLSRRSSQP